MMRPNPIPAPLRIVALSIAASAVLGGMLAARAAEPTKTDERRTAALAEAFAPVAGRVSPSVVAVRSIHGDDLGFGVAIDDGAFILTSRSILERVRENYVEVRTAGGATGHASILGRNEAYDVALLKLMGPSPGIEPLPLGHSDAIEVGQWVVTVGTAADRPIAAGVVSALHRRVEPRAGTQAFDLFGFFADSAGPRRAYAGVIQHDSPIDTDDYGAPLVDADGRLVGINVASVYRGSSFAAPIDEVAAFLGDLKAGRPGPDLPRPGYLGVTIGSIVDREVAARIGVVGPGVEIHAVADGFPAAKAGLNGGDVVLAIDGVKVGSVERFGQIVRGTLPGKTIRVRVLRAGKDEVELPVEVTARPVEVE